MKRNLILFALSGFLFACGNKEEKKETETTEQKSAAVKKYSHQFNSSITGVLNAYYRLKDAFVASDTVKVNEAGAALKQLIDGIQLDELKQKDSAAYESISGRPGDVTAEIAGMLGEKELEKKRESFEMISNAFYDLIRTIRPDGVTAYYQYCPMAFNDKGAYWLSNADSIRNPYFGKKMLTCGEVKEEMKY
jgi:Cu(I)/Ag(I) efflux system membrane fusion protein